MGRKTWCDIVYDDAIGKTAGTFDPINTNADGVKIQKKEAVDVLGFLVELSLTAVTDAEVMPNAILRVTNKSLGIANEDIIIPCGTMDSDVNNPYAPVQTFFVPFKIPEGSQNKLFNSMFEFSITGSVATTGGFQPVVGVVYTNFAIDSQFAMEWMSKCTKRISGGAYKANAALAHTGGAASNLTAVSIPAGVKELVGIMASIQPNGITAADPVCGWIEYASGGITDFSPQKWPFHTAWLPALGTVAEGAQQGGVGGHYWPTRFEIDGQEVTISGTSTIITTAGAAPDVTHGFVYNR